MKCSANRHLEQQSHKFRASLAQGGQSSLTNDRTSSERFRCCSLNKEHTDLVTVDSQWKCLSLKPQLQTELFRCPSCCCFTLERVFPYSISHNVYRYIIWQWFWGIYKGFSFSGLVAWLNSFLTCYSGVCFADWTTMCLNIYIMWSWSKGPCQVDFRLGPV